MPPDCGNCRACIANPDKVRYNGATKNKGGREMEERRPDSVPYIAHESEMTRMERVNKRWFVAWLITFILLVGCVAGFIYYESQFEPVETWQDVWQEADGGGSNQFIGGDYNGWPANQNENQNENP